MFVEGQWYLFDTISVPQRVHPFAYGTEYALRTLADDDVIVARPTCANLRKKHTHARVLSHLAVHTERGHINQSVPDRPLITDDDDGDDDEEDGCNDDDGDTHHDVVVDDGTVANAAGVPAAAAAAAETGEVDDVVDDPAVFGPFFVPVRCPDRVVGSANSSVVVS